MIKNSHSWLFKAVFLGLVFAVSVLVIKPVGVSTQFSMIGGMIHNAVDSSIITEDTTNKHGYSSSNAYYDKSGGSLAKSIKNPLNFAMVFLLAIPLGGFMAWFMDPQKKKKLRKKNSDVQVSFDLSMRNIIYASFWADLSSSSAQDLLTDAPVVI